MSGCPNNQNVNMFTDGMKRVAGLTDPTFPTVDTLADSLASAIAKINTLITNLATVDTVADGIKTATDKLGAPANASIAADLAEVKALLGSIDTDMVAGNIKVGVDILGVTGTFTQDSDAVAAEILATKTAFVNGSKVTGTMPNNTGTVASVSAAMGEGTTLNVVPAAGYTDGVDDASSVDLAAVDADLAAANIKQGVTVLGVAGTFTADADAVAADIVAGKTAYVNGVKITGTHE